MNERVCPCSGAMICHCGHRRACQPCRVAGCVAYLDRQDRRHATQWAWVFAATGAVLAVTVVASWLINNPVPAP